MAISEFAYDILRALDDAEGYISTQKVSQLLSEEGGRPVSAGRIRPYLEHALGKYVEQKPPDRWNISSPHHGKFSPSKKPASGDGARQSGFEQGDTSSNQEDSGSDQEDAQEENHDELSKAILQILADADTPLLSDRISRIVERSDLVSSSEIDFIKTVVNRRLYYELSNVVEKGDDHRWRLVDREYDETNETDETDDQKDGEADQGLNPSPSDGNGVTEDRGAEENDSTRSDQRAAGGSSDRSAEVKEQSASSEDKGTSRETGNESETSLGDFRKSILSALDEAEGYAFAEEIAGILQQDHGRDVKRGRVQFYLENTLDEYVIRKPSEGWRIASSHRGEFSSTEEVASDETGDERDSEQLDELSQLVVQELSEASSSLKVRHIADRISEGTNDVSPEKGDGIEAEVNRRLRGKLSARVETDDRHWWRLSEDVEEESLVPDSEAPEENVGESKPKTSDVPPADGVPGGTSEEENEKDELEETTPAGVAAKVGDKLETAKQITFLLDLARTPLSISRLTSLLSARGREVTDEGVKQRLESTLVRFVTEEEGKYRLKKDFDSSVGETTTDGSTAEKTEDEDTDQKPVDAATRASISGRRYDYVFESREMENASLFTSELRGGTVKIRLNASHAAFDRFGHILEEEAESGAGRTENQYRRLVRLLIVAWTEVEGDLSARRGELAEEIRNDWGRALRFLLQERDEE